MGVATGCGFKEIYTFPHTTYPYSSCICTFWQQYIYIAACTSMCVCTVFCGVGERNQGCALLIRLISQKQHCTKLPLFLFSLHHIVD